MPAYLEDPAVVTGLDKIKPHYNSQGRAFLGKKGTKHCNANHFMAALFSDSSKVVLKILHTRLQHYANQELPDAQDWLRKGRETRDQNANI